ncbi:uncharacterized protein LOC106079467 isoform X2 [Biomphalaria glabrata]|uniref:Uncharacterized protein LOC106079467 isoform X2 n=1 Tax=Biomphalaria glabrata TaxID=6526 RepID=A0A9W3A2Q4_BIOGL|nr:uncharacterized protein LOC106079467 isoform X2 [Biomphalaria glabrata]
MDASIAQVIYLSFASLTLMCLSTTESTIESTSLKSANTTLLQPDNTTYGDKNAFQSLTNIVGNNITSFSSRNESNNIINEELEKLEHSGYLFFPHIYRAFIRAGKSPEDFNISAACSHNLANYYKGLYLKKAWAWNMYDATGKQRAGILTGALTWAGNYQQCLDSLGYRNNIKEFQVGSEISAQYCSIYISTPSWVKELVDSLGLPFPPPHPPFIADVCTVIGCTELDIFNIAQTFLNQESWLGNYTVALVKCQGQLHIRDNAGAIITLCIASLLLLLVLSGTVYELYLRSRRHGVKSSRDIAIGIEAGLESVNLSTQTSHVEDDGHKVTSYRNPAFVNDETEELHNRNEIGNEQSQSNYVARFSPSKGVQFSSEVKTGLSEIPEKTDSLDKTLLVNEINANCISEHVQDELPNDHSVGEQSHDTSMVDHCSERRVSRRLSEIMHKSAAKIKQSFKIKTVNTDLPRMQKRHLKTQLSIADPDKNNRSAVFLLERCLVCFSLRRNLTNVLGKGHLDTLFCINGIRVMSIGWIVLGSYYSAFYSNPSYVDNHLDAVKLTQSFWIQAMINTTFAADTFFVLSGTLYAFNFMKQKHKQSSKKFYQILSVKEYFLTVIHRLARIVPCYYFILMIYTNLGPSLTAGSEFRSGLKPNTQCSDHWWANVLFISNFYMSDKMCMPWTYYLVNDFQFALLSPLVVIPMLCTPLIGFGIVVLLMAVHIVSVMVLNVGINGSVMRMGNTDYFSKIYIKPYCRVAPYVIGLALGYLLFTTERKTRLRKVPLFIGWFVCIAVVAILPYITYSENKENGSKWSDVERSLFEALSRPSWALCVAWIIFACCNGQGDLRIHFSHGFMLVPGLIFYGHRGTTFYWDRVFNNTLYFWKTKKIICGT